MKVWNEIADHTQTIREEREKEEEMTDGAERNGIEIRRDPSRFYGEEGQGKEAFVNEQESCTRDQTC